MKSKLTKVALGTLGYLLVTFPLAYTWHLKLFADTYDRLGYIGRDEPIIAFGFLAILLQGVLLSLLYPVVTRGKSYLSGVAWFVLLLGGYHWTTHVLAAAAKQPIEPLSTWFPLESGYLLIQFVLGGCWLGWVWRSPEDQQS